METVQTPVNFVLQAPAGALAAQPPAKKSHLLIRLYKFCGLIWPLFLARLFIRIPLAMQHYALKTVPDGLYGALDVLYHVYELGEQTMLQMHERQLAIALGTLLTLYWVLGASIIWKLVGYEIKNQMDAAVQTMTDSIRPGYEPEKVRPASVLMAAERPSYQAMIYGDLNGVWVRSGQAFKVRHQLITAHHVVESYRRLRIVTPYGEVDMASDRFRWVEGDVAFCMLSPQENQTLKLSEAKLANHEFAPNSGLIVKATGFDQSSYGFLKDHPAFGFVEYAGSTVPGFSGAPYVIGPKVYGMHLGGGVENLGLNGAYLDMLVRKHDEASEDFLFQQIEKYVKYDYEQSPYDPDEYRLRIGGRYYLVETETLHKLEGKLKPSQGVSYRDVDFDREAYEYPMTKEDIPPYVPAKQPEIQDEITEISKEIGSLLNEISGNASAPTAKSVGAKVGQPIREEDVSPRKSTSQTTMESSTPTTSATVGHELTPAQRSEVLQTIAKSLRLLRKELARLPAAVSKKSLKLPQNSSQVGRLISLNTELNALISKLGLMQQ